MYVDLNSVNFGKLVGSQTFFLDLTNDDQRVISKEFNQVVSDPTTFHLSQLSEWEIVVITIVVTALAALIYLIATHQFFKLSILNYGLMGVIALGIGKVIERLYCVKKAKELFYLAFAKIVCQPYIYNSTSCNGLSRQYDSNLLKDAKAYVTSKGWDDKTSCLYLSQDNFFRAAYFIRKDISKNPKDQLELFKDVAKFYRGSTPQEKHAKFLESIGYKA